MQSRVRKAYAIVSDKNDKSPKHEKQDSKERYRLLIDNAIDKLRGEINQKEEELYKPMIKKQAKLIEDHEKCKEQSQRKIKELEAILQM